MKLVSKNKLRRSRKKRIKVKGDSKRPRLSVFRSNKRMFVQLIDDVDNVTLAGVLSGYSKDKEKKVDVAFKAGEKIAKKAKAKKISKAVFDRGGYKFHGRVKAVLEGAQKGGLKFKKDKK
ncbi:MAG: 50S ribosomal protein L18 [Candidatus Moranbacteria bacterium]|nr:50S ribosomal protein L18 [Candidatus Moranbacteria bacterium]